MAEPLAARASVTGSGTGPGRMLTGTAAGSDSESACPASQGALPVRPLETAAPAA